MSIIRQTPITLYAANNNPVSMQTGINSSEPGQPDPLSAHRENDALTESEILTEWNLGDGYFALSRGNYFVTAEDAGGGKLSTNRTEIGPWEMFKKIGGGFQTWDGRHWICCEIDTPGAPLNASRPWRQAWETFREERAVTDPDLADVPQETGKLVRDGMVIRDGTGAVWTERGYSLFLAVLRVMHGEDIRADLLDLRRLWCNTIRVFGPLPWRETPDYRYDTFDFGALETSFQTCADVGMRVEFVPICYGAHDLPEGVRPFPLPEQKRFTDRTFEIAAKYWNVIIQVANEPHVNRTDPIAVMHGTQAISTRGVMTSYGHYDNKVTSKQFMQFDNGYHVLHSDRSKTDWPRKFRHAEETKKANKRPTILDEPRGAGEPNVEYRSARDANVHRFVQYHAGACFWTSGATLHSEEGKFGRMPTSGMRQREILEAVSRDVWRKIGPEWQVGSYNGSHFRTSPVDFLYDVWTYSTIVGNRALSCRYGDDQPPPRVMTERGWREVDRWGPNGCLVVSERG